MDYRLHAEDQNGRSLTWAETARVRGLRMLLGRRFQALSEPVAARLAASDIRSIRNMPSHVLLVMAPDVIGQHPNLAA